MRRTLNVAAVAIKEAIGKPVERRAAVRARIEVGDDGIPLADHEDPEARGVAAEPEALAAAIREVAKPAQQGANGCSRAGAATTHAGTPAILQSSFHSASPIATTERRDWRTSPRLARRGSALICCRVTGFGTGRRGLTSTMPKRPLASPGSG